ncbi:MAG TPA: glycosyltransferase [Methylomirabilota bacterium]|nr:glycosyltransferase [Methylomirabilota bacterium]
MKVSVVVPAFNEEKLLPGSLARIVAGLTAFSERGWATELIVCDNNSTDRTPDIARAVGARVVFEPVNQIGRARNAGARAATGDWLIFIDADSYPPRRLLEDVAAAIASGSVLAGGSTLALDAPSGPAVLVTHAWNVVSRLTRWAAGSFMFCEAAAFHEIGGFNPELYASEELDLFRRLHSLARRRRRRVVILHRHPLVTSARKLHLYSLREHLGFLFRFLLQPAHTVRNPERCHTWYDGRR